MIIQQFARYSSIEYHTIAIKEGSISEQISLVYLPVSLASLLSWKSHFLVIVKAMSILHIQQLLSFFLSSQQLVSRTRFPISSNLEKFWSEIHLRIP